MSDSFNSDGMDLDLDQLKKTIKDLDITQDDIAKLVKIDRSAVSRIFSGARRLRGLERVKIVDFIRVRQDELINSRKLTPTLHEVRTSRNGEKTPDLADDMLFGAANVARHMGISQKEVHDIMAGGQHPFFRIGPNVCARKSTIVSWIEDQEQASLISHTI